MILSGHKLLLYNYIDDVYLDRPTQSIWSHWEQNSHDKVSYDFPKAFLVTAHTGALFSNTLIKQLHSNYLS